MARCEALTDTGGTSKSTGRPGMMIERLTRQELRELIGTPVRARQMRWLRKNDWPHEVDALGYPIVLRSMALKRLGGEIAPQPWALDESNVA